MGFLGKNKHTEKYKELYENYLIPVSLELITDILQKFFKVTIIKFLSHILIISLHKATTVISQCVYPSSTFKNTSAHTYVHVFLQICVFRYP